MRNFTKTHFVIVRIVSLIEAIIAFIGLAVLFSLGIFLFHDPYTYISVILLICIIPDIVLAILLLKTSKVYKLASKMDAEFIKQNKGRITGWGVFFSIVLAPTILLFIVAIVCVILANNYMQDLIDGKVDEKTFGQAVKSGATNVATGSREVLQDSKHNAELNELENLQQSLAKLGELKQTGLITEEEYQAKRKKILGL
ncbi:MAG: SHOCT domain-containing protein [Christensenellales bacterium]